MDEFIENEKNEHNVKTRELKNIPKHTWMNDVKRYNLKGERERIAFRLLLLSSFLKKKIFTNLIETSGQTGKF